MILAHNDGWRVYAPVGRALAGAVGIDGSGGRSFHSYPTACRSRSPVPARRPVLRRRPGCELGDRRSRKQGESGAGPHGAWEQIEARGAYMDPEFVKPVEDKGKPVTIREGDKLEIQLNVIPR